MAQVYIIRVIVMKQWKSPGQYTAFYAVMKVVNFIISPELLETKIKDRAGMLNPYILSEIYWNIS